jgi:hypothetical protein
MMPEEIRRKRVAQVKTRPRKDTNALLSGYGFNLRKLLRALSCALQNWLSGLVFKLRAGMRPFRGLFAAV